MMQSNGNISLGNAAMTIDDSILNPYNDKEMTPERIAAKK